MNLHLYSDAFRELVDRNISHFVVENNRDMYVEELSKTGGDFRKLAFSYDTHYKSAGLKENLEVEEKENVLYFVSINFVILYIIFFNIWDMKADTIENDVTELTDTARSIDDIKKSYPDEWIILGEPEIDEDRNFISGVVLYHSSNKKELICRDKPLLKKYKYNKAFYNKVNKPAEKTSVIASVFSTLKP